MSQITASLGREHYVTHITSPVGNTIISDEPKEKGGEDKGLTPKELLASALASCVCITVRMYADRKEWPLEKIEVTVEYDYDNQTRTSKIVKSIKLYGDLDEEQKKRMYIIAEKLPVSQSLSNPIHMETKHL
ncbi:MAG: OsmC family protein [Chitinophagaceae bacterium]|nr:OsmC family protein [Chitinophagaceae bacterium]